jgi:hypothetical protein
LIRASIAARLRLVIRKAARSAEEALRFSANDLERTDALEALADAFFQTADGDLAWRYYREAARLRAGAPPEDPRRVAYLASRAADVRLRWPGSIRGIQPSEAETREMMELGFGHPARRLGGAGPDALAPGRLGLRVPRCAQDHRRPRGAVRRRRGGGGDRARIGRPDLASAALDNAQGAWAAVGNYTLAGPVA